MELAEHAARHSLVSDISLGLFLTMALMGLRLWELQPVLPSSRRRCWCRLPWSSHSFC